MEEGVSEIVQKCVASFMDEPVSPNMMANKRRQKINNEIIRYDTKQAKTRGG